MVIMFSPQFGSKHRACASEGKAMFFIPKNVLLQRSDCEEPLSSEDLQACARDLELQTKQVAEWQTKAWRDLSEDLKMLIGSKECSSNLENKDVNTDAAEGLFANIRQTISTAKSQVNSFCFKCRGKYSEVECKKGVSGALEKMASELWKRLKNYALRPFDARLSESFDAVNQLNRISDTLRNSLIESITVFSTHLSRYLDANRPHTPTRRHISFVSEVSEDLPASETKSYDISEEVIEDSNRLLGTLQKLSSSGPKDRYTPSLKYEMEMIIRDMESVVKTSKEDTDHFTKDLQEQQVERHLTSIRARIMSLCSEMEDLTSRLPTTEEIISNLRLEVHRLETVVVSQATEIHKLKESQGLGPRHEKDPMISIQSSILAEVLEVKKMIETSRLVVARRKGEDVGTVIAMMRAMTPEIEIASDSGFLEKFGEEAEKMRRTVSNYLSALALEGMAATTLEGTSSLILKVKKENESLKKEIEEVLQRYEQMRTESELEIEYLESRLHSLEEQKEEKTAKMLAFSEPQSPISRMESINSFDDDGLTLTTDDSTLAHRFEIACKERARLLTHIADLQSSVHLSEEQVFAYRHLYGDLPRSTDLPTLFYETENDEEVLSMKISVALEMLKDRSKDVLETLSKLIDSVHQLRTLKRKAIRDELIRAMEGLRRVAGASMENFVETRRVEGQLERLEAVLKSRKPCVHFSEVIG